MGFEPTILGSLHPDLDGSEGPRLSPGSTTGPCQSVGRTPVISLLAEKSSGVEYETRPAYSLTD